MSNLRLLGEDFCHHLQEDIRFVLDDRLDRRDALLLSHGEHVLDELLPELVA